ncbi:MAG: ABC transporter permease [Nanoarchaeota archaeon]|nr:ABC transporter permease [Nanoarchaeota archaeon]MBU1051992.1 ABC transporter permease [Nanoarchaeota archaeon]MBU1988250.1 ABC transporter permease [Nanoarchaeota archaeon]
MVKGIQTIWLRSIRKALADKWNLLIGVGWLLFLIFILGFGIDSFVNLDDLGVSYTELLGPGIIALMVMGGALSIGNQLIEDKGGFIKELLVSPISRPSIFLGMIFGEMTINLTVTLVAIIFFLLFIKALSLVSLLLAIVLMLLIAFGFYGFGIVLSSFFKKAKSYQMINGIVMGAVMFLSGSFYPIGNLPLWFKWIVKVNPLTYGVDGLRAVLVGFSEFGLLVDVAVLAGFGVAMLALGSYLFSRGLKK